MVRTNHFIFMFLMLGYTVPHTPRRGEGVGRSSLVRGREAEASGKKLTNVLENVTYDV